MKRGSTIFLQTVIVLIGIGALAFLLLEPQGEGRNVDSTQFEIYFKDPFLACAYVVSVAFFAALYQAFKLLGYIRQNKIFSPNSVRALRIIKYCTLPIIVFTLGGIAYLFIVRPEDDIAGSVAVGGFIGFVSIVVATVAGVLEKVLQNAVDTKSENDVTV